MNIQFAISGVLIFLFLSTGGLLAQSKVAPNKPNPSELSGEEYSKAKSAWIEKHPAEYNAVLKEMQEGYKPEEGMIESIGDINPIPGQDIKSITDLAPHFPKFVVIPDVDKAIESYNKAKATWQNKYAGEYIELKAFMMQNVGSDQLPRFMRYPVSNREPLIIGVNSDMGKMLLVYELRLMNWRYAYKNKTFSEVYGDEAKVPSDFNIEAYKASMAVEVPDEYDRKMFFEEGMDLSPEPQLDKK